MELPVRLREVASLIPAGTVVVDVGADHGLLAAWLARSGRFAGVIATDKSPRPLARARARLAAWGVTGVELRLGDGLEPVRPGEADVAVIAGLGAGTVTAMLARAPGRVGRLILQPMTGASRLRGWLAGHGFRVVREHLALDRGRLYDILVAEPGGPGDGLTSYPPLDAFRLTPAGRLPRSLLLKAGPLLLATRHPLLPRRLTDMREHRRQVAATAAHALGPRGRRAALAARREEQLVAALCELTLR